MYPDEVDGSRCGSDWVKRATTDAERRRLGWEAQVLTAVRHPGVVQLAAAGGGDGELALVAVGGGDLANRRLGPAELAGLGAAAATTLADLHDLGVIHGALHPEHILIDDLGRPVLCSFGRAQLGGRGDPVIDVRGLAAGLLRVLDHEGSGERDGRRLRRLLQRAEARGASARWLAGELASSIPEPRLPAPNEQGVSRAPDPSPATEARALRCPGGARAAAGALAAGVILAAVAAAAAHLVGGRHGVAGRAPLLSAACPAVDEGCRPLPLVGSVFSTPGGAWSVGQPGDVVVVGRWTCHAPPSPAVLRPGGQVWVFDRWAAPGHPVPGRLVGDLPGARSLTVLPGRQGCDRLEVLGPFGPPRTVVPAAR